MADFNAMLKGEQLISLSENFDYVTATADFVGLKLFPPFKTDNMKLAIAQLTKMGKIPTIALIHAFDTEARIGDRPNYETFQYELLLIKEKLNQGESIRKLINDTGMNASEKAVLNVIFNDVNLLIARVFTRVELLCMEALCTGKAVIKENGYEATIDYGVPTENVLSVADWHDPDHSILSDIVTLNNGAKGKIKRMIINDVVLGYLLSNNELKKICSSYMPIQFLTEDFAKNYISGTFGIDVVVDRLTYKRNATDTTEYKFVPDNRIAFLATDGVVGNTFFTSTPEEDYDIASQTNSFVAVTQYKTPDPAAIWTKASAIALPCPSDSSLLYPCTITKTPSQSADNNEARGDS